MRQVFRSAAVLALLAQSSAIAGQSQEDCKKIASEPERLSCYDAASATSAEASPVRLSSSFFNVLAVDAYRGINVPRIELHVSFANASGKPVTGLSVFIRIKDAFGDDVLATDAKMDIAIAPHTQTSATPYFFWEDNEIMPDNAYRKIYDAVWTKKAKVDVAVKKILFSDGSVEAY